MPYRLLTVLSLVILCGCAPPGTGSVHGIHQRSSSFSHHSEQPVPGIDEGQIVAITLQAGPPSGVSFVVWSDMSGGSGGHGGADSSGASYEGEIHLDGRSVAIHAETTDGISGTLTIDESTYDLNRGELFLISTQDGATTVKQIEFDVTDFPTDHEELDKVAEENPEIGDFFQSAFETETDDSESLDDASP